MKYPQFSYQETGMATECSKGVSVTTDHIVHMRHRKGKRNAYAHHRKSARELLEASKGEYVKSRQVLNHRQELKHPENLSISSEPVALFAIQTRHTPLEDDPNTLNEGINRKLSEDQSKTSAISDHHGPSKDEDKPRCLSPQSSRGITSQKLAESSPSAPEEQGFTFKKPLTPPKLPPRPVVPPKPAAKPTTPPVPRPKPTVSFNLDSSVGKPVPPPRPSRQQLDQTDSSSKMAAPTDKTGASAATTAKTNDSADIVSKRFSSLSAHATVNVSRDSDSSSDKNRPQPCSGRDREARCSVGSQNEALLKPLCSSSLSTSVGVLLEKKRSPLPKPRVEKQLEEVELPPQRRQLHRSHSDLSSCRHSRNSSDFSDLSSRLSRTSTEVERFFNEMGLDRTVLEPMRKLADAKKNNTADSNSSLETVSGQSFSSRLSQNDLDKMPMESEQDLMDRSTASGSTSVVERNARIIKWLCNVKKARTAPRQVKKTKPVPQTSS